MENPQSSVSERIKKIYAHFGDGNLSAFSRQVGVAAQTVRDLMKGDKGGPSWPVLQNILQAYPSIELEWLLRGEGEMLKTSPAEDTPIKNSVVSAPTQSIEHGKPVTHKGETVPTFRIKGNRPTEPVGTDLVRQVDENTREIELMQQTLETVVAELRQLNAK